MSRSRMQLGRRAASINTRLAECSPLQLRLSGLHVRLVRAPILATTNVNRSQDVLVRKSRSIRVR
jgi:hypothetical protein